MNGLFDSDDDITSPTAPAGRKTKVRKVPMKKATFQPPNNATVDAPMFANPVEPVPTPNSVGGGRIREVSGVHTHAVQTASQSLAWQPQEQESKQSDQSVHQYTSLMFGEKFEELPAQQKFVNPQDKQIYQSVPEQIQSEPQQSQTILQQSEIDHVVLTPVVPAPEPSASANVWPSDLPALPKAPFQGTVPDLAPLPAAPIKPETDPLRQQFQTATSDGVAWESFLQLRKQLDEAHQRTMQLHGQISQVQLSHEKEAVEYRESVSNVINNLNKEVEVATENFNSATEKIESLSQLLAKKAETIMTLEMSARSQAMSVTSMAQKLAHMEDRVRVANSGCQIAEVRQKELELTLEHTVELVVKLRKQMQSSHEDKANALMEQYRAFEQSRQDLIEYYNEREKQMTDQFNISVRQVQALMDQHVKEREEKISKHWKETIINLEDEYKELKKRAEKQATNYEIEFEAHKRNETLEKENWIQHLKREMDQLEQRHKDREAHVLTDICRRERELGERESRARTQRLQDEQESKIAVMNKEAELKAYYEKLMEDMRASHDTDRERMSQSFRDQIQQLQNLHLNNERELERMHREKEREMAQRYRIAGYEVEDQKGNLELAKASEQTKGSLLSKFDSVAAKQIERAEQTRTAIKTTSFSNVALTPGVGNK